MGTRLRRATGILPCRCGGGLGVPGTFSKAVYRIVNERGQFSARRRRRFGALKSWSSKELSERRDFGAKAPNCQPKHPSREKVPSCPPCARITRRFSQPRCNSRLPLKCGGDVPLAAPPWSRAPTPWRLTSTPKCQYGMPLRRPDESHATVPHTPAPAHLVWPRAARVRRPRGFANHAPSATAIFCACCAARASSRVTVSHDVGRRPPAA
jgi:hypothetical protein